MTKKTNENEQQQNQQIYCQNVLDANEHGNCYSTHLIIINAAT